MCVFVERAIGVEYHYIMPRNTHFVLILENSIDETEVQIEFKYYKIEKMISS